jgi:hypothetical protein
MRSAGERLIGAGGPGLAALLLGVLGGVLLGLAEFLPILQVEVNGLPCPADFTVVEECEPTGGDRHSYGLILLGVLVVVMSFGAGPGESLPAAIALAVAALFAIGIVVLADLRYVDDTGAVVTSTFEEAEATSAIGLWAELAGGALALLAAVAAVLAQRSRQSA